MENDVFLKFENFTDELIETVCTVNQVLILKAKIDEDSNDKFSSING